MAGYMVLEMVGMPRGQKRRKRCRSNGLKESRSAATKGRTYLSFSLMKLDGVTCAS